MTGAIASAGARRDPIEIGRVHAFLRFSVGVTMAFILAETTGWAPTFLPPVLLAGLVCFPLTRGGRRERTRLILDVLLGDPPLFPQHQEVELSWEILDPILDFWAEQPEQPELYEPGSWGPAGAEAMLARDGFAWRRP